MLNFIFKLDNFYISKLSKAELFCFVFPIVTLDYLFEHNWFFLSIGSA
jgi:hypothetical protein